MRNRRGTATRNRIIRLQGMKKNEEIETVREIRKIVKDREMT